MASNPLGIVMICETCARRFPRDCQCKVGEKKPSAFLPLRHVPDEYLEQKRAELLEFNSTEGLRKLTDEERERLAESDQVINGPDGHADEMDTAENVQSDSVQEFVEELDQAEPPDLLPGEGFGSPTTDGPAYG